MELVSTFLVFLFGATTLASLASVIVPIKSLGIKSRKEAGQTAIGSVILFVASLGLYDFTQSSAGDNAQEGNLEAVPIADVNPRPQNEQEHSTDSAGLSEEQVSDTNDAWKESATSAIASEPKVVDAMFPNNSTRSFWVSMRDDGSRRDGYAEYVCLKLYEHGMPKGRFVVIRIWDAYAMAQGDMKETGRFECQLN